MTSITSLAILFAQADAEAAAGAGAALFMLLMFACWGISILFGLAAMAFWIWMLIDCATNEPSVPGSNEKLIWVLVVVLAGAVGAAVYYFARRPKRIAQYGR